MINMDINEALEIVGSLVDQVGSGEESEAMGVINEWVQVHAA